MNSFERYNLEIKKMQESNALNNRRTATWIRWAIYILLGFIPMTLFWLFLNDGVDKMLHPTLQIDRVSYPHMHGIAWGTIAVIILIIWLLVRFVKSINLDVMPGTLGAAFMMATFYLFYPNGNWRYLIAPFMFQAGYELGRITQIIYFTRRVKSEMQKINQDMNINPQDPNTVKEFQKDVENSPEFKAAKRAQQTYEDELKKAKDQKENKDKDEITFVDDEE